MNPLIENPAMYFVLVVIAAFGFFIFDAIQTHKAQPWRAQHCHVSNQKLDEKVAQFDRLEPKWKKLTEKSWETGEPSITSDYLFYHQTISTVKFLELHKNCFVKPESYKNSEIDLYGGGIGLFLRVEGLMLDQVQLAPLEKVRVRASDLLKELNRFLQCKAVDSSSISNENMKSYEDNTYRICITNSGQILNVVTSEPGSDFNTQDFPAVVKRDKTRSPVAWSPKWYVGVFFKLPKTPSDSETKALVSTAKLISENFGAQLSIQS